MSRKLEEYLKRERAALDVESPDESALWERIAESISARKRKTVMLTRRTRWIRIRNIAAVAFILFSLGYITKDITDTLAGRKSVTLSSIDRRLGRREQQYKTMVSYRLREIKALPDTDEAVINELFCELKRVDTIYRQSMADLRILGPDEKIINTIFDTYEQKIRLLELIILETNKIKDHEYAKKINL